MPRVMCLPSVYRRNSNSYKQSTTILLCLPASLNHTVVIGTATRPHSFIQLLLVYLSLSVTVGGSRTGDFPKTMSSLMRMGSGTTAR